MRLPPQMSIVWSVEGTRIWLKHNERGSPALYYPITLGLPLSGCCINRVSIASACFLMADLFHFNTLVTR